MPMILLDLNLTASDSFQTVQIPFFLTLQIVDTNTPEKHAYIPSNAHLTVTKIFPRHIVLFCNLSFSKSCLKCFKAKPLYGGCRLLPAQRSFIQDSGILGTDCPLSMECCVSWMKYMSQFVKNDRSMSKFTEI